MIIPSTFTSFPSIRQIKPSINIHKPPPLIIMNAINKNKSNIIKVKFDNIDDELRDFDDKLLKFNFISE